MKQNLQKSIFLPFIGFIILLTIALISWATILMTNYFYNKEYQFVDLKLKYAQEQVEGILKTSSTIVSSGYSLKKTKLMLIDTYDSEFVNAFYSFEQLGRKVVINKNDVVENDAANIYVVSIVKTKFGSYKIKFDLKKFLVSLSKDLHYTGVFVIEDTQSFVNVYSSELLVTEHKEALIDQFYSLNKNLKLQDFGSTVSKDYGQWVSAFSPSSVQDNVIFFITTKVEGVKQLILKTVLGMIFAIFLATAGIFVMYMITIRRLRTSIDVLRAVSKKVAKGNFNEKVYIETTDEIGELSSAFNQMISKLKLSTETIIQQKDQSDAIISSIPDGIIVTNFNNKLILANHKAEDIFEFKSQKNYLTQIEDCIGHSSFKEHSKQLKRTTFFKSEFVFKTSPNKQVLSMTSKVVLNIYKNPIGIVYVIRDVTYEKQIEELREGFLRTVSHELRTPLTSVIGFIELVSHSGKGVLSSEQESCLKTALYDARSLKVLINDLLELSQMQAEQTKMNYTKINIYEFVEKITYTLYPLAKGKNLQIINSIQKRNIEIIADEKKLRRILINLISNGIKFTPEGHIKVSCIEMDDKIEFCVSDTGIGLKDNEKDVIFEKFRQIDYSSKREYQGIGLGLSIVKELVELHKGNIKVESEINCGSNFYFTIEKKRDLTAALVS